MDRQNTGPFEGLPPIKPAVRPEDTCSGACKSHDAEWFLSQEKATLHMAAISTSKAKTLYPSGGRWSEIPNRKMMPMMQL
jgi:hypothetical protein